MKIGLEATLGEREWIIHDKVVAERTLA